MSIHPLPSGKFSVRYRDGGKHRSKTFSTRADAEVYEAQVKRKKETGGAILHRSDVPTLREEALSWLASRSDLTTNTEELYASVLRLHVLPELGALRLTDLRARRLEEWQARVLKTTGTRAVQMARGVLSQVLDRAVAHELLESNKLKLVKGPSLGPRRVSEVATPAQVEEMRSYFLARGHADYALLISLLAYVGLRPPQEPMALMWSDVDGKRLHIRRRNSYGEIIPRTKGNRQRIVLMPDAVATEMAEYHLRRGRTGGLMFPRKGGQPWTKNQWGNWRSRGFAKARAQASLPDDFTPYSLRHTAASLMLASGRPLPEVAHQLGHSIQVCAGTYSHLVLQGEEVRNLDIRIKEARLAAG